MGLGEWCCGGAGGGWTSLDALCHRIAILTSDHAATDEVAIRFRFSNSGFLKLADQGHIEMSRSVFRHVLRAAAGLSFLGLGACVGTAASGPVPPGTPIAGYGYTCKAGIYTCKMPTQVPLGAPCSCPGLGAASYGNIHQP